MTYNFDPERWHENEYSAIDGGQETSQKETR